MNELKKIIPQKKQVKEYIIPEPSKLKISTMTIITKIGRYNKNKNKGEYTIDLDILSRFIKIDSQSCEDINSVSGGIIGIDYYSNILRGISKNKCPFYNQATVVYNYWGFRSVNIKIFNNGKLQMTGIIYENEAKHVTKFIINRFKQTKYRIYKNLIDLPNDNINDYSIVFNPKTLKYTYYRYNYNEKFDNNIVEYDNINKLKGWVSDTFIYEFLIYLNKIIEKYDNNLLTIKSKYEDMTEKMNDNQISDNGSVITKNDIDKVETEFNNLSKKNKYLKALFKRYVKVRVKDISTMNNIIEKHNDELVDDECDEKYWEFPLLDNKFEYKIDTLKIELINSNYTTKFPINNTLLHNILNKKYKLYSSYEPNDYPGVKTKFLWNKGKKTQDGICRCEIPCVSLGKKSVCTQITIAIFQSGSVIITGAKNVKQIKDCYNFINHIFKKEFKCILSVNNNGNFDELELNNKEYELNETKKILRKKRLFYIKKEDIIGLPATQKIVTEQ